MRDLADGKRIVSPSVAPVIFDLISRGESREPGPRREPGPTR